MKCLGTLITFALLATATPAHAQSSLLGDVQAERAKYGPSMSRAEVASLLNAVAWRHRAEGWGLLRKGSGNSCPLGDTFISCDILVNARTVTHFDVLIDAENTARPNWGDDGPCVISPSSGCAMSNFMAPIDPGSSAPTSGTTPPSTGTTSTDLSAVLDLIGEQGAGTRAQIEAVYQQNERMFANLVDRLNAIQATVDALQSRSSVSVSPLPALPPVVSAGGGGFWTFIGKYVLPAVGGVLAGMQAAK